MDECGQILGLGNRKLTFTFKMASSQTEHPSCRRVKKLTSAASLSLDDKTLPHIVTERIATFLSGKDLLNLGRTCSFWNEVSKRNRIWKALVEYRFGKLPCSDRPETKSSPMDYKKLYFELGASKKPVTEFYVLWLNGDYLEKVRDRESCYGEVIQLNSVCWLQINKFFEGVLPGKYTLRWRMKLDGVYVNIDRGRNPAIEFRAKPADGCGSEICSKWVERDLKRAERRNGSGKWFLQDMGQFQVTATCKVYVEIKGRVSNWCGGMSWDYVQLRPH